MHPGLVDYVFKDVGESKDCLLGMMESYGLIAAFNDVNAGVKRYLVPALLSSLSKEDVTKPSSGEPCALYFDFVKGFIPHGLFHQFVCQIIRTCQDLNCVQMPLLHRNFAQFVLGYYYFIVLCEKRFIKVTGHCDTGIASNALKHIGI